jgi:hypothetical protein
MAVRIGSMVLRLVVLAALVLGILFWIGTLDASGTLLDVHRTLGILTVLACGFWPFLRGACRASPA